jgi:uncharacterized protein with von Willebrand factor type A (vWA) domain
MQREANGLFGQAAGELSRNWNGANVNTESLKKLVARAQQDLLASQSKASELRQKAKAAKGAAQAAKEKFKQARKLSKAAKKLAKQAEEKLHERMGLFVEAQKRLAKALKKAEADKSDAAKPQKGGPKSAASTKTRRKPALEPIPFTVPQEPEPQTSPAEPEPTILPPANPTV